MTRDQQVLWFEELDRTDVPRIGGKNASLGEKVQHLAKLGVAIPPGYATTAAAYWNFIDANRLKEVVANSQPLGR
jgi:pyruvate,water dikinase